MEYAKRLIGAKSLAEVLKPIRDGIMEGIEDNDMLYIKMQLNKLDTIIYELNQEK